MQKLNEVVIDQDQTLANIMETKPEKQQNPTNLYDLLSQNLEENTKKKKAKPKKKAVANQATTPLPKVPPPTQTAATTDKEGLILKIQKYQSSRRFGTYITKDLKISQSREQLVKLSIERLENILHRIRLNLNSRNLDAIFENMALTCANGYETTMTHLGFNISGFSDLLTANPGFWDAYERWRIEKADLPDIPPGIQLAYIVSATTIAAYNINQASAPQPSQPPTENEKKDKIILDEDDKKVSFSVGKNI